MDLDPEDIRIDGYRAGDSSSWRAIHIPTGHVVTWNATKGDGQSLTKLRAKALADLAALVDGPGPDTFTDRRSEMEKSGEDMEEMMQALKTADAWLERWAQHVGSCRGGSYCTCGLTRVRYEVRNQVDGGAR